MLPPKTVVTENRTAILEPLLDGMWIPPIIRPVVFEDFGLVCVDRIAEPTVCSLALSDFVFFAGDVQGESARYFVQTTARPSYVLPSSEEWIRLVRASTRTAGKRIVRTSFSSSSLETGLLRRFAAVLPQGFELRPFDGATVFEAASRRWSQSFVENFGTPASFLERGIGFGVFEGGRLVSGASSFATEGRTVEIEVDTHPRYRRKGLATAVSAHLVLECLEQGLVPHWDAANPRSCALAEKLGFTAERSYEVLKVLPRG
jgi:GNAT superfamily N-acetyltransferase